MTENNKLIKFDNVKELLYGIASEDFSKACDSAYRLEKIITDYTSKCNTLRRRWNFETEYKERENVINGIIRDIIQETGGGFANEFKRILSNFTICIEKHMNFLNGDKFSTPDFTMLALKSMTAAILCQAGDYALPVKDDLLKLLCDEYGSDSGWSTTAHKSLACKVLSNFSEISNDIFKMIVSSSVENQDPIGRKSILDMCLKDHGKIPLVFNMLENCTNTDYECELLTILICLAEIDAGTDNDISNELTKRIFSDDCNVVSIACDGLLKMNRLSPDLEREIIDRRNKEIADNDERCHDNNVGDHYDFVHEETDCEKLLLNLKSEDSFERGMAAEALAKFANREEVAVELVKILSDDEPIHDFDIPAVYAIRSLVKAGSNSVLALNEIGKILDRIVNDEVDRINKNKNNYVNGVKYLPDETYNLSDIGKLIINIGKPAEKLVYKLKLFEHLLIVRDVCGFDRRIEQIRNCFATR
jgi:hypothetical protein